MGKCGVKEGRKRCYFEVSDEAILKLKEFLGRKDGQDAAGIRISFKIGGCNGVSYKIEFAKIDDNISEKDDTFVIKDIPFFIDRRVSFSIMGSVMDYTSNNISSGFLSTKDVKEGCCGAGFC